MHSEEARRAEADPATDKETDLVTGRGATIQVTTDTQTAMALATTIITIVADMMTTTAVPVTTVAKDRILKMTDSMMTN